VLFSHSDERARGEEEEECGCTEKTKDRKRCFSVLVICVFGGLCCGFFFFLFKNKTSVPQGCMFHNKSHVIVTNRQIIGSKNVQQILKINLWSSFMIKTVADKKWK